MWSCKEEDWLSFGHGALPGLSSYYCEPNRHVGMMGWRLLSCLDDCLHPSWCVLTVHLPSFLSAIDISKILLKSVRKVMTKLAMERSDQLNMFYTLCKKMEILSRPRRVEYNIKAAVDNLEVYSSPEALSLTYQQCTAAGAGSNLLRLWVWLSSDCGECWTRDEQTEKSGQRDQASKWPKNLRSWSEL